MTADTLTGGNDYYESELVPGQGETGNSIFALAGNDTVFGNQYEDFIDGGAGHDQLYGGGGDDLLLGGTGNDLLHGGTGDDLLIAGDGHDDLHGDAGADTLWGGAGDDWYFYSMSDGGEIDTINDDLSPTGSPGAGGGTDYFFFGDVLAADIWFEAIGDDLYVTDVSDVADGFINSGVVIEDFFLGGDNVIERVYGSDNYYYDLSSFV